VRRENKRRRGPWGTLGIVLAAIVGVPVALTLGVILALFLWGFFSGLAD
jgi:hypothetical protein